MWRARQGTLSPSETLAKYGKYAQNVANMSNLVKHVSPWGIPAWVDRALQGMPPRRRWRAGLEQRRARRTRWSKKTVWGRGNPGLKTPCKPDQHMKETAK